MVFLYVATITSLHRTHVFVEILLVKYTRKYMEVNNIQN